MYMVISQWKPKPGKEADFERIGSTMREMLRRQPGVVLIESMQGPDAFHVVHVYENEASYAQIVDNPDSFFNQKAAEYAIDDVADWVGSIRGETRN